MAEPAPAPKVPLTSRLDNKALIGIGLLAVGVGIFLGYRLRAGTPDVIEVPSLRREPAAPCADCAERAVQAARAVHPTTTNGTATTFVPYVQETTAGDSSVPGDDLE